MRCPCSRSSSCDLIRPPCTFALAIARAESRLSFGRIAEAERCFGVLVVVPAAWPVFGIRPASSRTSIGMRDRIMGYSALERDRFAIRAPGAAASCRALLHSDDGPPRQGNVFFECARPGEEAVWGPLRLSARASLDFQAS